MVIYKITNNINGKVYIGQTITSIEERIRGHKNSMRKYNYPLYNALSKYGIDNFTVEEIDKASTQEGLNILEREYIEQFNSTSRDFGYNILSGGNSEPKPEEVRLKIGKAQKGSKNHMYAKKGIYNPKSKAVICENDGKIFSSATEAGEYYFPEIKHGYSQVASVCRGNRKSARGKIFRYASWVKNKYEYKEETPKNNRAHKVKDLKEDKEYDTLAGWIRDKDEMGRINTIKGSIRIRGYFIDVEKDLYLVCNKYINDFTNKEELIQDYYKYKVTKTETGELIYYVDKTSALKYVYGSRYKDSMRKKYYFEKPLELNGYVICKL